jgi:hypothetical protein
MQEAEVQVQARQAVEEAARKGQAEEQARQAAEEKARQADEKQARQDSERKKKRYREHEVGEGAGLKQAKKEYAEELIQVSAHCTHLPPLHSLSYTHTYTPSCALSPALSPTSPHTAAGGATSFGLAIASAAGTYFGKKAALA